MHLHPALPSLNALRAFDSAARNLSFTLAAQELGVTLSAVAQQIRALESELGMKLFTRQGRALDLTDAGRAYASSVERAFGILVTATRALRPEPLRLAISVTPTFAGKWLIPRLNDFNERHPNIDLHIVATDRLSTFKSDNVDLAVRYGRLPFGPGLNVEILFEEVLIAVASDKLVDRQSLAKGSKSLEHYPLLHDSHNLWPLFFDETLNFLPIATGKKTHFNQTSLAIDAAIAGQGIALAARLFITQDLADGRLVQVAPREWRTGSGFYVVWPRRARHTESVAAVRDCLFEMAARVDQNCV